MSVNWYKSFTKNQPQKPSKEEDEETDWLEVFLRRKFGWAPEGTEKPLSVFEKYDPFQRFGIWSKEAAESLPTGAVSDVTTLERPIRPEPEKPYTEKYREYEKLPLWQRLSYESPLWGAMAIPQLSATKLWGLAGQLPKAASKLPKVVRAAAAVGEMAAKVPLSPFYGLELGIGKALPYVAKGVGAAVKYGVAKPYSKLAGALESRTYRGVKQTIEKGVDIVEGAAKKGAVPITKTFTGKVQAVEKVATQFLKQGEMKFDQMAAKGKMNPFVTAKAPLENQVVAELKATATGRKPVSLISGGDIEDAKKLGLVIKRIPAFRGLESRLQVWAAYKPGQAGRKAFAELSEVYARTEGGQLGKVSGHIEIGKALGYSDDDVAKYLKDKYGSYQDVVNEIKPKLPIEPVGKEARVNLYRGEIEEETNRAIVGLQEVARSAKNVTEFNKLINTQFENPKLITNFVKKNYGSTRNFYQVAHADAFAANVEANIGKAQSKIKDLIKESRAKWEPTLAERAAEYRARAGSIRGVLSDVSNEGESAFFKAKGTLKGELPSVKPIGDALTEAERKTLSDRILLAFRQRILREFEAMNAFDGLQKVYAGRLPQMSEMVQMEKVFGADMIKALLKHRGVWARSLDQILDVVLLPRSLLASGDFSAPLRQGLFLLPSHPLQSSKAFVKSVRMFFDKKYYNEVVQQLTKRELASVGEDHLLFLGSTASTAKGLVAREEAFMSRLAERLPLIGHLVKASERAYVGYLDMFRASVFDATLQGWGVKATSKIAPEMSHKIGVLAKYVNWSTGRGDLPASLATGMNALFFSPRLQTGRIGLPFMLLKMLVAESPALRKVAARDLLAFGGAASTTLGLAYLGGATVELNPVSADFGKAKIGNTRIDMLGGFGQYATYLARNLTGDYKEGRIKASSGRIMKANRGELLVRLLRTKASPVVSMMLNTMWGTNVVGEEMELGTEYLLRDLEDNLLMMAWQDIIDATEDSGWNGLMLGMPAIFGAGVQTYDSADQLVGEVRYLASRRQEANQKLKEMRLKGEYDKISKFILDNPEIRYGEIVSSAYNEINRIEQQIKELELRPIDSDTKEKMIETMKQQQINIAIPVLLRVDQYKMSREASKQGITIPEEMPRYKSKLTEIMASEKNKEE
uniref:Uncharacterized protein n=1 Tax=viral metagenome TaxID=1070528 RepID=A0A6H1ZGR5_9ZZZZ